MGRKVKKKKVVKKPVKKEKKIVAIRHKNKSKLTENKIKRLLDFEHIEELFHLVHALKSDQVKAFIKHYKESEISKTKDKKLDKIIKKSETKEDLLGALKKELAISLKAEQSRIEKKIALGVKKGNDLYVAALKVMSVPPKIQMFNGTSSKSDYYKVKKLLLQIDQDIDEMIDDQRREDKQMAKVDNEIRELRKKIQKI